MSVSRKVFIFNGESHKHAVSQESAEDLHTLMQSCSDIFAQKPDIVFSDFKFNAKGLNCPTFIVPGGYTGYMGNVIRPSFDVMHKDTLGEQYNYIGVCAGGMIGSTQSDIFLANASLDPKGFRERSPREHFTTYTRKNSCAGLVDVTAIGTFYPIEAIIASKKTYTPYKVLLDIAGTELQSRQLFAGGCGFDPTTVKTGTVDIVATYADRKEYPFFFAGERKSFSPFPAVVRQKPTESRGGRILSGTHFETCVKDSRLLSFFAKESRDADALSKKDNADLKLEGTKTAELVKDLFKTSLK